MKFFISSLKFFRNFWKCSIETSHLRRGLRKLKNAAIYGDSQSQSIGLRLKLRAVLLTLRYLPYHTPPFFLNVVTFKSKHFIKLIYLQTQYTHNIFIFSVNCLTASPTAKSEKSKNLFFFFIICDSHLYKIKISICFIGEKIEKKKNCFKTFARYIIFCIYLIAYEFSSLCFLKFNVYHHDFLLELST